MGADVTIVGGGLAGSEAAWQLAERGVTVRLYEMRPVQQTPVHRSDSLAELVCSNSLKSLTRNTAAGMLKSELAVLASQLLRCALETRVAAGGALAVDREAFSQLVTTSLADHPNVEIVRKEADLACLLEVNNPCIIATGPLTSPRFEQALVELLGCESLSFFDAAAPIVEAESLDTDKLFLQSRYGKGEADYLNAALTREEYDLFVEELAAAKRVIPKKFETRELFSACQPVEEVVRKGSDTLRFGALKPVGLTNPATGHRPWAVVQLRPENRQATAYNLVGFQTNLLFSEQERVFRLIPGLEHAVFSRYGVMHRNTFVDSPRILDRGFALKTHPHIRFAGQITGTEGYTEAFASGLLAALNCYAQLQGREAVILPATTAAGSLFAYATDDSVTDYQPMHVNLGIIEPLPHPYKRKQERYQAYSLRSEAAIREFRKTHGFLGFLPEYDRDFLLP
ncbi:MAG: methylenetetrahydrofolate--tRNA-(uracil(54)-C(5))-methyltransferase (FADH(2)-oxidizing) TrmFO [Coriobacteriia bacterium]|nr:methylenetetrahydrofolate--tRNA-(uracil(54)-C(5))-methyltransferase (FADH(2)-oxidizing) TrmFO [Coriobacteriia bacterium]